MTEIYLHAEFRNATAQSNPFIPSILFFIDFKASHRAIGSPNPVNMPSASQIQKAEALYIQHISAGLYWMDHSGDMGGPLIALGGMDPGGGHSNRLGVDSDFNNATQLLFPVDPALLSRIEDRRGRATSRSGW